MNCVLVLGVTEEGEKDKDDDKKDEDNNDGEKEKDNTRPMAVRRTSKRWTANPDFGSNESRFKGHLRPNNAKQLHCSSEACNWSDKEEQ